MNKKNNDITKHEHHKSKRNPVLFVFSVLLLAVIAVAFVFSPGLLESGNVMPDLGTYDGQNIKYDQDFVNLVEYFAEQLEAQGQQGDPMFSAMTQAFNYSVLTLASLNEAEKAGYIPPSTKVKREMIPYFVDENGVYSERIFQETSDGTKLQIEELTIESIIRNIYFSDIAGLKISSNEIDFIKDMNKTKRSFNMASFDTDSYPKEEVVRFGTDNADLFVTYSMNVITINEENTAKTVANRIANNELTFTDAIAEYSIDQYSNDAGELNDSLHYQLKDIVKGEDAFNALISLESGSVSDVVETTTGYSIFSVTANPKQADLQIDELVDAVYNYLLIYESGIIEDYFINKAKDFNVTAVMLGYDEALAINDLENIAIDAFPVNYANIPLFDALPVASSDVLAQAQTNEQFFQVAFSLEEGQFSEPLVLGKDIVVLSLVDEIVEDVEGNQTLDFMYPYYVSQFDSNDISSFYMGSDKLENNLFSVLLEYFL